MTPTRAWSALLENHLLFTALHRATVTREPTGVTWTSESPEFCALLLSTPQRPTMFPPDVRRVRTFSWTAEHEPALEAAGFQRVGCLRYMSKDLSPEPDAVTVPAREASSREDIDTFTDIQARSFAAPEDDLAGLHAFLAAANHRNLGHPAQDFFIASSEGTPVSVNLLLVHEQTAGIYAVATLPEHRRHGHSRALLSHALAHATARGCEKATLQVHRGSDAERLYLHLGFRLDFDSTLWARDPGRST